VNPPAIQIIAKLLLKRSGAAWSQALHAIVSVLRHCAHIIAM
jgi:hypothetical protein